MANQEISKEMFKQVIACGDEDVMFYLNDGWAIEGSAPNPFPQPYIYWFVSKLIPEQLTRVEIDELRTKSRDMADGNPSLKAK